MNLQETIALIGALKEAGATHFKSHDFEVTLDGEQKIHVGAGNIYYPPGPVEAPSAELKGEAPIDQEKTKKIEDLIDVLRMKDDQLVDQIFPAGS